MVKVGKIGFGTVNFQNTFLRKKSQLATWLIEIYFVKWEKPWTRKAIDVMWGKRNI